MGLDIESRRVDRRTFVGAAGGLVLGAVTGWALAAPPPRVIEVVAKKFEFVPAEIQVKKGEAVTFQFTAPEVPMGFNLADFNLRVDIVPGKVATLQLTPDKTGTFTFLCDVFCGTGHEDMSGTLVVT
jgi:cytochrome c oxidase subunit 2